MWIKESSVDLSRIHMARERKGFWHVYFETILTITMPPSPKTPGLQVFYFASVTSVDSCKGQSRC